jgi:uncharacterized membrane protein
MQKKSTRDTKNIRNCSVRRQKQVFMGKFTDRKNSMNVMHVRTPPQKILQGILHTERESKPNHERTGSTKPQEKKK